MNAPTVVVIAMVPLIAWRLYARMRRFIGRQRSRPGRHWAAVLFFPALLVLLAASVLSRPTALAALAGGVAAGSALAWAGLRLTRFERTAEGWYYTPNAHIGIALSAILVARIAWRLFATPWPAGGSGSHLATSPLTLAILGVLASYYALYAAGLLAWRRRAAPHAGNIPPN